MASRERPWEAPRALLGLFGGSGRSIGAILEAIDQNSVWHFLRSPRRGPKSRLWGPTWAALGALLDALGPVLGLSWARLGALLGHLGAILRPQEPIGSEKERRPNTVSFHWFWNGFGLSGASLGGSAATWSRLGAILGPLVAILGPLGALLELLGANLGPLGAILGLLGTVLERPRAAQERPRAAQERPRAAKRGQERPKSGS